MAGPLAGQSSLPLAVNAGGLRGSLPISLSQYLSPNISLPTALSRQVPRRLPALRTPMRRPTRPCPTVASLPLSQQPEPRAWVGVTAGCGLCAGPAPRDPRAHQKQFATEGRTASAGESPGSGYDLVGTPGEHTGESVGAIGIFRRSCDNRGLRLARCKSAPGPACSSFKDSVECPLWPPRFRN